MTDQTKCPHCGAEKSPEWKQLRFHCGTIVCDGEAFRSSQCELKTLRAKVAAQQELLREAAEILAGAVTRLEWGEDWDLPYVQKLTALSVKLSDEFPPIASPAPKSR